MKEGIDLETEIEAFLAFHIKCVSELEVLLTLYTSRSSWSPSKLSIELRLNPFFVEEILNGFVQRGLVDKNPQSLEFFLKPSLEYEWKLLKEVQIRYLNRRYSLINAIYRTPNEKLKMFANAFKYKE